MSAAPVIGLTGGIGTGKSTVSDMLAELGATVIDADNVGHEVYRPGTDGFRQVVDAFGTGIVAPDGTIDRRALGGIVFADPAARARLNAIVHPLIGRAILARVEAARGAEPRRPIVIEAAILLEAGWRGLIDRLWVVSTRRETAIARVAASRSLARDEIERRMAAQADDAERRRAADLVIENDGSVAELRTRVEAAWRTLAD